MVVGIEAPPLGEVPVFREINSKLEVHVFFFLFDHETLAGGRGRENEAVRKEFCMICMRAPRFCIISYFIYLLLIL